MTLQCEITNSNQLGSYSSIWSDNRNVGLLWDYCNGRPRLHHINTPVHVLCFTSVYKELCCEQLLMEPRHNRIHVTNDAIDVRTLYKNRHMKVRVASLSFRQEFTEKHKTAERPVCALGKLNTRNIHISFWMFFSQNIKTTHTKKHLFWKEIFFFLSSICQKGLCYW